MTQIEDLLRQTLAETPTHTADVDPLGGIDRRVRRARRWLAAGAGVGVAVVTAAVVVPLMTLGGPGNAPLPITHTPTPTATPSAGKNTQASQVWMAGGAHGVASNDVRGYSYVVTEDSNAARSLAELGIHGKTLRTFPLPDSASFVEFRDGVAWVWGGGDGAFPDSKVTAVDVNNGDSATLSLGRDGNIQSLAITEGGAAWATTVSGVRQLKFSGTAVTQVAQIPIAGALHIVANSGGTLWVQAGNRYVELKPKGGPDGVGATEQTTAHWNGPLLADAGGPVWTTDDPRRAVELDPSSLSAGVSVSLVGKRLPTDGRPTAVVPDGAGGVYIACTGGVIDYFAPGDETGPVTVRLRGADAETMTVSYAGGVLFTTFGGTLEHWAPRVAGSR